MKRREEKGINEKKKPNATGVYRPRFVREEWACVCVHARPGTTLRRNVVTPKRVYGRFRRTRALLLYYRRVVRRPVCIMPLVRAGGATAVTAFSFLEPRSPARRVSGTPTSHVVVPHAYDDGGPRQGRPQRTIRHRFECETSAAARGRISRARRKCRPKFRTRIQRITRVPRKCCGVGAISQFSF